MVERNFIHSLYATQRSADHTVCTVLLTTLPSRSGYVRLLFSLLPSLFIVLQATPFAAQRKGLQSPSCCQGMQLSNIAVNNNILIPAKHVDIHMRKFVIIRYCSHFQGASHTSFAMKLANFQRTLY